MTIYIYCMLVREIWKFIHPRVSYFPRGIGYSWVNKFSYFLNLHAINVLLHRMKPRKHIHVRYCWQTYFKSIGTLSFTFKNHIHNNIVTVACKWCIPSASDVFLSKNDNSGGETREVHSSQLRLIPYLHHTSPVRITIAPIGTTFGNLQWRGY